MTTRKIWLGVGAFVVAGTGAAPAGAAGPASVQPAVLRPGLARGVLHDSAALPWREAGVHLAQMKHGGEAGEEGGEKGAVAKLPPDLSFALAVTLMRGHLRIGNELVQQGEWNGAFPHFLHPLEELYGGISGQLADYQTPPFADPLKHLVEIVKHKTGGEAYDKALGAVLKALDTAQAGVKAKQSDWPRFVVTTVLEALKTATGEYEQAIVDGRIAKPVEYQDARGFVWQAEAMFDAVAPALEQKDAEAVRKVRADFAELKKAWPTPLPPMTPVKDYSIVLGDVARIELHASRLAK